jgi:tRNA A-37 threonylcarbamoyl transferase component Bud32
VADQRSQTITATAWYLPDAPAAWRTLEVQTVDTRHYHIKGEVARGGVGRILEAVDNRLHREVALKELLRAGVEEQRFVREAIVTARLQHPAIIPIYEVGVFTDGKPFIAMKLVRGGSLREAIRRCATLEARLDLVAAVVSVADAVAYAHSQRVIHRDLKPSNVLVGDFGEVVVIDWGLAKHLDGDETSTTGVSAPRFDATATATGAIVGTPAYMPPEQAAGGVVDERVDVYAIGAMLYEIFAGKPPHAGKSAQEVLHNVVTARPAPLSLGGVDVPRDLAAIIDRAMAYNASARYANAAELAADLRRFQRGQIVAAVPREDEHDVAIEAEFLDELDTRTAAGLRVIAAIAVVAIAAFGLIPRLYHGRWVPADVWPRTITCAILAAIYFVAGRPGARRHSQWLGIAMIVVLFVLFSVVNVIDTANIGWFTPSVVSALLGCVAFLPLTPRRVVVVAAASILCGLVTAFFLHWSPTSVPFLYSTNMIVTDAVTACLAIQFAYRIRRSEFYNRHRLQVANERLAKLDKR